MRARWTTAPIARLAAIGYAPGDDADTRVRKATLTLTAATIAALASVWTLSYLLLDRPSAAALPFLYQAAAVASLVVLARTHRYGAVATVNVTLILLLPFFLQWTLGGFAGSGGVIVWSFLAPLGALVFLSLRVAALVFAAFVALVALSGLLDPWFAVTGQPLDEAAARRFFVLDILGVASVVMLVLAYFVRQRQLTLDELHLAHRALQDEQADLLTEQERSATLLRNILPDPVAQRLKDGERLIADRFEAVTVLFVDIVDFTPLAARLPASDLVRLLDAIFASLEALCERHGLEKIKTAGDAFMAVAGLPAPRDAEEGAVAAAGMAFDVFPAISAAVQDLGGGLTGSDGLKARVGLHTGPVVAGVIGRRKFAYDLWGDAVNVASRMESQGLPGQVQVSLATWQHLQRHYHARRRGSIEIKGRGEMDAYLLVGPRHRGGSPAS